MRSSSVVLFENTKDMTSSANCQKGGGRGKDGGRSIERTKISVGTVNVPLTIGPSTPAQTKESPVLLDRHF
jgi:hypothetical protein